MKTLITGGAGFIGSHVVDACCERGMDVVCVDSLDSGVHQGPPSYLRDDVQYCFRDLRDWEPGAELEGVQAIVHLAALGGVTRAAKEKENVISANAVGTARLAEIAQKISTLERFVLISSFSVYGANYSYSTQAGELISAARREADLEAGQFEVCCPDTGEPAQIVPITTAATPDPLETYASSKYMQELAMRGFLKCPVSTLRLSSAYGSRLRLHDSEATIIAKLAGHIRGGQSPQLFEDGQQIRDWVHVKDVVAATLALLGGNEAPRIVNVCSGQPTTLLEACELIAIAAKVDCRPEIVGGYRLGDMRHCLGDASELEQLIGRKPILFEDGVSVLVEDA